MRPLTIERVLVATDLSDDDVPALRTAMALSRLAGSDLHVVHANQDGDATLEQKLEEQLRSADPESSILPGTTIRGGHPDRVIVDVAAMIDADVVILGPHRPGRLHSPGSTAYRVAAEAERPCLVLPRALRLPLGRIMVPVDASGAARGALAVGLTWASALRRRVPPDTAEATGITVLHVRTPATGDTQSSPDDLLRDAIAAAGERVTAAARVKVECLALEAADAADAILGRATADDVDLIVLGTRAQHSTAGQLGSVSAAVIERAECPILLVPPRIWRHEQES
ncbi:MAG TPA: universal stress protein [Longimicrobiales bacterium]|nr:universal stress protein [Longimicrobiales bacterium]